MDKFALTFKALLQIIDFILFYLNDIEILTKRIDSLDLYKGPMRNCWITFQLSCNNKKPPEFYSGLVFFCEIFGRLRNEKTTLLGNCYLSVKTFFY